MTTHHLPEPLLVAYAAGGTSEAEDVLVGSHLTLCPACRARLAELEDVGGAVLDEAPAVHEGMDALLAGALAALDAPAVEPVDEPVVVDPDGVFVPQG